MGIRKIFRDMKRQAIERGALAFQLLRSLTYTAEQFSLVGAEVLATRTRTRKPWDNEELFLAAREGMRILFAEDARNIAEGLYPISVLKPEPYRQHLVRFGKVFWDALKIARRRKAKKSHEFSVEAKKHLEKLPEYYRRNFHFQGDGYLSDKSAELYDHQVEVLFFGSAGAMRRLAIPPIHAMQAEKHAPLRLLELGAGVGSATHSMRLAFPHARIDAVDLSRPYVEKAREVFAHDRKTKFRVAKAEALPFSEQSFDAVYSVFVFHELPEAIRTQVIQEAFRVLKPGGRFVVVDSLQLGDNLLFDGPLEDFPVSFHEPFYANYIKKPLEAMFKREGFVGIDSNKKLFSKCIWGARPAF